MKKLLKKFYFRIIAFYYAIEKESRIAKMNIKERISNNMLTCAGKQLRDLETKKSVRELIFDDTKTEGLKIDFANIETYDERWNNFVNKLDIKIYR